VSRTIHREWPGAPGLGRSVARRANDVYGMISPALITPSSIARARSASLLGAVRPVAAYLARARLMYCRTVFSLIDIRRATDALDMPWNHNSSACMDGARASDPYRAVSAIGNSKRRGRDE